MLRRILVILLVVVVIIAAIFAVQWFLNRNNDDLEAVIEEGAEVVDDVVSEVEEAVEIEDAEGQPADADDQPDGAVDTEQPAEAYPAVDGGEAIPVEDGGAAPAETGDTAAESAEGDAAMGGTAESGDPNAGGGMPADSSGETAAAPAEDAGTGGEAAAVSPAAAFVQPGVATEHKVENLEWLMQLARCYGTTVTDIQAANNYAYPDLIQPGWVVKIANPGNAGPITINDQPCFKYHTVQQGETLYSIATQYGINFQWLARINAVYNYNLIYAGQMLVIPNPVDPVFTQTPAQPYYSLCWYGYCPR
ncbi:MAG: LysM peptidoglycan-binding domain-containing protein [Chloroflexota bacterium]